MTRNKDERTCEKALLAVLPLFEFSVTSPEPNAIIQIENLDNDARRLQTFRAKFLVEVRRLRKLLKDIENNNYLDTDSDEYIKNLTGTLDLFDCHISDDVDGLALQNVLVRILSSKP
jgi:hypothetical protein